MRRDDEHALLLACQGGDIRAFGQVVHLYQDVALRTAYLLTNDRQAAEDIAQNAFLSAFRHICRFDATRAFRPWFLAIVTNEARMYMRRQRRQVANGLDPQRHVEPDAPLLQLIQADERARVRQALADLDEPFRTAAVLYYFNDLSIDEIAGAMGCLPGTVKSRLYTARARLRQALFPLLTMESDLVAPRDWKLSDDPAR